MNKAKAKKNKVMKKKDKVVRRVNIEEEQKVDMDVPKRRRMRLGSREDKALRDSLKGQDLKPTKASESNVYAFLEGIDSEGKPCVDYEFIHEHWVAIDGKIERLVCNAMAIEDEDVRAAQLENTFGYVEGCKFCKSKMDLYNNHDKESKDAVDVNARLIAGKISAKISVYLAVIEGKLDIFREKGSKKTETEPLFSKKIAGGLIGRRLKLDIDTFEILEKAILKEDVSTEDLIGTPFNLVGGYRKKKGKFTYDAIERAELYPKHKLKSLLPKNNISFEHLLKCDQEKMDRVHELFERALPDLLSGKKQVKPVRTAKPKNRGRRPR